MALAFATPVRRGPRHRLEMVGRVFEVDADVGGRVVEFSFEGRNLLLPSSVHARNYGSTFWTSPQSQWDWPPPAELDTGPYDAAIAGEWLVLEGAPSARVGVAVTKAFRMDERGTVRIRYGMTHHGEEPVSLSPWEVTRVERTGVTFFPLGARTYEVMRHSPLPFTRIGDVAWIDHGAPLTHDRKLYADSGKGYLAHVLHGVVFVKEFERRAGAERAMDEAEIEIYASADPAYVELEEQGPLSVLAPGASITWGVQWRLIPLPEGVSVAIGEAALVDLVESALAR